MCKCPKGLVWLGIALDGGMKTCGKIHPCDTKANGGCEEICKKNGEGVTCMCKEGSELNMDGKTCSKGKFIVSSFLEPSTSFMMYGASGP